MIDAVKTMAELERPEEIDVLYWIGCAAATDERIGEVARAMARVLDRAGVRFAVLGDEERCTGDPARRTGNELHYYTVAQTNIQTLNRYGITSIVTHCPHCFHTLSNDYPQLGGHYEVIHHSEFVQRLIEQGRLDLAGARGDEGIVFHDPCYLGRYNSVFEAPRSVLDNVTDRRLEMRRSRDRSFCCGAGGGHALFEERTGGKVSENRAREVAATGAATLCTACPFCLGMLREGMAATAPDRGIEVLDLVELVDRALVRADVARSDSGLS